ncbi:MAG: PocR ligand-binding domain-containing protein [Desulfobacter sp.]|nr:MAG: PocR ligand-binding domain-containing protein [Desulfobacter sp.]
MGLPLAKSHHKREGTMDCPASPGEMEFSLSELIDIPVFQGLCDSFFKLTGLPTAILNHQGEILIASGWKTICTRYHRVNPATAARCLESDTILAGRLQKGEKFTIYQCKNGLIDVATPIIIENQHMGNLFAGQFLFDKPDMDFFVAQAKDFGFDRETYLAALADVPILTHEAVTKAMNYLVDLTDVIARAGIDKKRLLEMNRNLEYQVRERTKALKSEKIFSDSLIRSLPGVMYVLDRSGQFTRWNRNLEAVTGYSKRDIMKMDSMELIAGPDKPRAKKALAQVFKTGQATIEAGFNTISGRVIPYLFTGFKFRQKGEDYLIGVGLDISERLKTENEKATLIGKLQQSLEDVEQLSGLLPICASCKKIRDDKGYWNQIESYIHKHSRAQFSHGLCPECSDRIYGDQAWYKKMKKKTPPSS